MRLAAERVLAAPVARGRNRDARTKLAALHKGLIAGDEDEVIDDDGRTVAGRRNRLAGKADFFDRPVAPRDDGDHGGVDVGASGEATRHDDRRARRNVAAELGKARQMIGMHRLAAGVVLVDAHGVRQIAAEFLERAAHALQDVVGFAPQRRTAAQATSDRPFDLAREPALEIERLVAVEENPRPRLDRVGETRAAARELLDRFDGQRSRDACACLCRLDHGQLQAAERRPQSSCVAILAPSASDRSFAHMMVG